MADNLLESGDEDGGCKELEEDFANLEAQVEKSAALIDRLEEENRQLKADNQYLRSEVERLGRF